MTRRLSVTAAILVLEIDLVVQFRADFLDVAHMVTYKRLIIGIFAWCTLICIWVRSA